MPCGACEPHKFYARERYHSLSIGATSVALSGDGADWIASSWVHRGRRMRSPLPHLHCVVAPRQVASSNACCEFASHIFTVKAPAGSRRVGGSREGPTQTHSTPSRRGALGCGSQRLGGGRAAEFAIAPERVAPAKWRTSTASAQLLKRRPRMSCRQSFGMGQPPILDLVRGTRMPLSWSPK